MLGVTVFVGIKATAPDMMNSIDKYYDENQLFYYDYFRFLVLVIYIKRMPITIDDYINANSFVDTSESIKRYFKNFLDYKEETS